MVKYLALLIAVLIISYSSVIITFSNDLPPTLDWALFLLVAVLNIGSMVIFLLNIWKHHPSS